MKNSSWIRMIYSDRDFTLRLLGFSGYPAYLRSETWYAIRSQVLVASPACFVCGAPATQVHHTDYAESTLSGSDISTLRAVCRRHHRAAEFYGGRKRSLSDANRAMVGLKASLRRAEKRRKHKLRKKAKRKRARELRELSRRLDIEWAARPGCWEKS